MPWERPNYWAPLPQDWTEWRTGTDMSLYWQKDLTILDGWTDKQVWWDLVDGRTNRSDKNLRTDGQTDVVRFFFSGDGTDGRKDRSAEGQTDLIRFYEGTDECKEKTDRHLLIHQWIVQLSWGLWVMQFFYPGANAVYSRCLSAYGLSTFLSTSFDIIFRLLSCPPFGVLAPPSHFHPSFFPHLPSFLPSFPARYL